VDTFATKIAPAGLADYVFLVNIRLIPAEAKEQAERYFAQGHEVNFVDIRGWISDSLATVGVKGRSLFNAHLQGLLEGEGIPQQLKAAWNGAIQSMITA